MPDCCTEEESVKPEGGSNSGGLSHQSSTSSSPTESDAPPDGDWGWLIVFCSFYMCMVLNGLAYTSGIYFPVFMEEFDESASKTAWIGSLYNGCSLAISPLAGVVTNKFGCRKVCFCGSIWACLSLVAAAFFSNSVEVLMLTWGVSAGLAYGFMFLPSIVIVDLWFKAKRGLAIGITMSGTGIGLLLMPPLVNLMITQYGWRKSLYAVSALVFFCAPLSLLYRKVPTNKTHPSNSSHNGNKKCSHHNCPNGHSFKDCKVFNKTDDSSPGNEVPKTDIKVEVEKTQIDENVNNHSYDIYKEISASVQVENVKEDNTGREKTISRLAEIFGFKFFSHKRFVLLLTSSFFGYSALYAPFTYLTDYATLNGIDDQRGSFLISITGIANTVGRPLMGFLVAIKWVDSVVLLNSALILAGLLNIALPFLQSYWAMCLYATFFGLCLATEICMQSLAIIQLMGLDSVTYALGYYLCVTGVAATIGVPIIGLFYNEDGEKDTYMRCFFAAGSLMIIGGIIGLPLQKWPKWQKKIEHSGETGQQRAEQQS